MTDNIDFLRWKPARTNGVSCAHIYFKPISARAKKFCMRPAVHALLCREESVEYTCPVPGIWLGHSPEFNGWYEYHATEFRGSFVMEPPFTYADHS